MISVYDEEKLLEGETDPDVLDEIWCELLRTLGLKDEFEAEITVVDKEEIRALNRENRGVDAVTDVLSFPAMNVTLPFDGALHAEDKDPGTGNYILGDIALCAERAVEQAAEFGHSVKREVCYLVLHGLCHLFGFDHETEEDKKKMRKVEEDVLTGLGITR